jgi:hypothetical protein
MLSHLPVNLLLGAASHRQQQQQGRVADGAAEADNGSGDGKVPWIRALILGGGDGGVLSRLLEHEEVAHVTMVEIDAVVMATAAEYFPFVRAHATKLTLQHCLALPQLFGSFIDDRAGCDACARRRRLCRLSAATAVFASMMAAARPTLVSASLSTMQRSGLTPRQCGRRHRALFTTLS